MEKYSSTSLAHQWILCMEWVPSDPLVSKYVMLNYSKSVPVMKKKIYILNSLRVSIFSANAHFWGEILLLCSLLLRHKKKGCV